MSWNHFDQDICAYNKRLAESTSSLQYMLDPNKFYPCNQSFVQFGLVGGNTASITTGNMVDLESDLFNITRQASTCPERKYLPFCEACEENGGLPCGSATCKRAESLRHLPVSNIIQYTPRIDHVGFDLRYPGCGLNQIQSITGQKPAVYPSRVGFHAMGEQKQVMVAHGARAPLDPAMPMQQFARSQ